MIKNIEIENFKSIKNLSIDLGRVNVIIGANGSGKTNILEAIALASASSADKLDYEFLSNRIRISMPEFMYNAFPNNENKHIKIKITTHNNSLEYLLTNENKRTWIDINKNNFQKELVDLLTNILDGKNTEILPEESRKLILNINKSLSNIKDIKNNEIFNDIILSQTNKIVNKGFALKEMSNFLIYTPEYSYLKKFEEPGQIIPLGLKGEGLFYIVKNIFNSNKKNAQNEKIKEYLHLLDWFDDFFIPKDLMSNEFKIAIKDKFLNPKIRLFDQNSANEGFLFLLFYLILFTSRNTPKFFAIDNIETGFNPKLCRKIMSSLTELSKDFKKQVILTTHNPAILDGLNLKDDKQRLFVAYRKRDGSTALQRIKHKPNSQKKLSELWMSGFIGGLPDNFQI